MRAYIIIFCLFTPFVVFSQNTPSKEQAQGGSLNYFDEIERIRREYPVESREKGTGWKQQERWIENTYYYTDQTGTLYNSKVKSSKEFKKYESSHPEQMNKQANNGLWENMGGSSFSFEGNGYSGGIGRVNCFVSDPDNTNILFVGTPAGGLWKSYNDGQSWTPLTDDLLSAGVSGIVISYQNSSNMYMLMGDGDGRQSYSTGIMKSSDSGISWNSTNLTFLEDSLRRGFSLIIDPLDENHQLASFDNGLYVTDDAWDSWSKTLSDFCFDIEFKPGNTQIVYVASDREVYRSVNGGLSFGAGVIVAPNAPDISTVDLEDETYRIELAVTPAFPNNVYLTTGGRKNGFIGLYRSVNSGFSWSPLSEGGDSDAVNILNSRKDGTWFKPGCQATYDLSLAIAPVNPTQILNGGVNLWGKNTSANNNWDIKTYWAILSPPAGSVYMHGDIHELVYVGSSLYCCNDGGLFKSLDHGTTWTDLSDGLIITQFYEIDSPDDVDGKVLGGTQDNGTNLIEDDDAPNMMHVQGGDGAWVRFQKGNSSNVYCSYQYGQLNYSTDGGHTFNPTGYPNGGGIFVTPYENIGNTMDIWYGGWDGLYYHPFGSSNWTAPVDATIDYIKYLSVSVNDTHIVYYCESDSLKVREYDLGVQNILTDEFIHDGLPVDQVFFTSVTANQEDNNTVVTTFSGYVDGEKVYISDDKGENWTNISGSLPNVPIMCAEFEPGNNGGIYVGTDIGVFYRNDDIGDWIFFSYGLPRVPIRDLDISTSDNQLRAATFGRSIWQIDPFSVCPPSLFIVNFLDDPYESLPTNYVFEASQFIFSDIPLPTDPGTNIVNQAGDYILLLGGFEVSGSAEYEAKLGPCTGAAPPLILEPEEESQSNSLNSEQ